MQQIIEKTGRTPDEAIAEALVEMGATRDEVEVKILDAGAKGILGIGSKPAKIVVTRTLEPEDKAKKFLSKVLRAMKIEPELEIKVKERQMTIEIVGKDMGVLIGKRGQTLDALQYLTNLIVNSGEDAYIGITLDAENYRARRKETLEKLAHNLAKKAKLTHKSVVLEPMNPYERRIIHSALQSDKSVTTRSEGEEPYRNVVIVPVR